MKASTLAALLWVGAEGFTPIRSNSRRLAPRMMSAPPTNKNVEQTLSTSREEVMTFSYDMSLEPEFEKPTYPGTGNGLSGEEGEYDVIVIGSGMGGLACGAMCAKYGDRVMV